MPDHMPLQLLLATFAGWTNRHQAQVFDHLVEGNRVPKEHLRLPPWRVSQSYRDTDLPARDVYQGTRPRKLRSSLIKNE